MTRQWIITHVARANIVGNKKSTKQSYSYLTFSSPVTKCKSVHYRRWLLKSTLKVNLICLLSWDYSGDGVCSLTQYWDYEIMAAMMSALLRETVEREFQNSSRSDEHFGKRERKERGRSVEVFPAWQGNWLAFLAFWNTLDFPTQGSTDLADSTSKNSSRYKSNLSVNLPLKVRQDETQRSIAIIH